MGYYLATTAVIKYQNCILQFYDVVFFVNKFPYFVYMKTCRVVSLRQMAYAHFIFATPKEFQVSANYGKKMKKIRERTNIPLNSIFISSRE